MMRVDQSLGFSAALAPPSRRSIHEEASAIASAEDTSLQQQEEDYESASPLPAVYGLPDDVGENNEIPAVASLPPHRGEDDDDNKDDEEHQQKPSTQQLTYAIAAQAATLAKGDVEGQPQQPREHNSRHFFKRGNSASRPGAVAVGGEPRGSSANFDPTASGTSTPHTVVAEVAGTFVDEDEVRKRVHQEFLRSVVRADVVPEKKWQTRYLPGCMVVTVMLVTITTFLSVLLTRNHSRAQQPHQPQQPTSSPVTSRSPTQAPSSWAFSDFENTYSNLTILDLLDGAPNHTLLAEYFQRNGSYLIQDYLNTQVTLFAPTDASFRALPVPYSYYSNDATWEGHLVLLLAYHIVTEPLNRLLILSATALETVVMPLSNFDELVPDTEGSYLPINQTDMTVDGGAHLILTDIPASNGYIQVPDRVLLYDQLRYSLFDYVFSGATTSITNFQGLIQLTGKQGVLFQNYSKGFTLLIPSDAAFARLDSATQQALFSETSGLAHSIVSYHMAPFNLYPSAIRDALEFNYPTTLNQTSAWVTTNGNSEFFVNTALIENFVFVRNGVVIFLDQVLFPPTIGDFFKICSNTSTDVNFDTFSLLVEHAKLSDFMHAVTSRWTVFAPVENAFLEGEVPNLITRLTSNATSSWLGHLQNLIRNHVTSQVLMSTMDPAEHEFSMPLLSGFNTTIQVTSDGNLTFVDDTKIIPFRPAPALTAVNGILYAIDKVLLPPWVGVSIYDEIKQRPDLSIMVRLLNTYNLTGYLNQSDDASPLTLLAPNDAAWAAIDGGVEPHQGNFTFWCDLVLHHVLEGNLYAAELWKETTVVQSVNHQRWSVQTTIGNQTMIGGAIILKSNVLACNGVIHIVDRVLGVVTTAI